MHHPLKTFKQAGGSLLLLLLISLQSAGFQPIICQEQNGQVHLEWTLGPGGCDNRTPGTTESSSADGCTSCVDLLQQHFQPFQRLTQPSNDMLPVIQCTMLPDAWAAYQSSGILLIPQNNSSPDLTSRFLQTTILLI